MQPADQASESYEKLFDGQIETLARTGDVPCEILDLLYSHRSRAVSAAGELPHQEGQVPFLPVIPQVYLSLHTQMRLVAYRAVQGVCKLDPRFVTHVVSTPSSPYYILDVNDGRAVLDLAIEQMGRHNRRALTAPEIIALGIHARALDCYSIAAFGSRHIRPGCSPQTAEAVVVLAVNGSTPELQIAEPAVETPAFVQTVADEIGSVECLPSGSDHETNRQAVASCSSRTVPHHSSG